MKKLITIISASALILGRCTPVTMPDMNPQSESVTEAETEESSYAPINYEYQKGMWLPYLFYENALSGKTEDEFREAVRERLTKASDNGINTVYIHAIPDGSAYYRSELYPKGTFLDGDFDPLEIMTDEAHKLGLSVHAWINPLRLQNLSELENLPESYITKKWYSQGSRNIGIVGGRAYLRPDSQEVLDLLESAVTEIIENYSVDGIHIDDYFYPTTDEDFDADAFAESGSSDLSTWRTNVVTEMVRRMHDAVKKANEKVLFGISPQGNIKADYETQYADVKRWLAEEGFCDYMIPQIYYGFRNETLPFDEVLSEWLSLPKNSGTELIIGLGAYKLGKDDIWAGETGGTEWKEDPDIIDKQIQAVLDSSASGYALYY